MAERRPVAPRTFFLNETHEHARDDRKGWGPVPPYARIDWRAKGERLANSLRVARAAASRTTDPLRDRRLFLLSRPEVAVEKHSTAKKAKDGLLKQETDIGGEHARIFERLGLDLIQLTPVGEALVHAKIETIDQLETTAAQLGTAGKREQARWALLSEFKFPPIETRIDLDWLEALDDKLVHEVIIELQPVLTRSEFELVSGSVRDLLVGRDGEDVFAAGRDLSGRRWLRARLRRATIKRLGTGLISIQSIHSPLRSVAFSSPVRGQGGRPAEQATAVRGELPAVAVLDGGVPREHVALAAYRRGEYRHAEAEHLDGGDHGSRVASRIVFGEVEARSPGFVPPPGVCKYLDVVLPCVPDGNGRLEFDDKAILESLREVARNYRDVRVFNLSLGTIQPLSRMSEQQRYERLVELQDLDNFAFEHDVVVVVAAGNTAPGMIPAASYPDHVDELDWGMGGLAAGFNTLVVGSFVGHPNSDGVARRLGWPSPFTRVGPGIADGAVPNFSASGGDGDANYQFRPGVDLGVWTLNQNGLWEDASGTSFAAPLVAREAAIAIQSLQQHCGPGVQPFAALVKAWLCLVARHRVPNNRFPSGVQKLAQRTLGRGLPEAGRLTHVRPDSAVLLWQGTLERAGHVARVRVPVPREWLAEAVAPCLRAVAAWNGPVFAGAPGVWGCRRVNVVLRPNLGGKALRLPKGAATGAYPIVDRTDDLSRARLESLNIEVDSDEWVVELDYSDEGPYPPSLRIDEQQRVGLALELFDAQGGVSPQAALQSMPLVQTMIHLGGVRQPVWAPIRILTG
jgi:hypothetical protein